MYCKCDKNGTKKVTNIFMAYSNDWPIREDIFNGYEEEALGSLMLSAHKTRIPEFDEYFLSRNANNNERNPWFKEYWNLHHKVCLGDQQLSNSSHQCSGRVYKILS